MAYRDFTLKQVKEQFELTIIENEWLFSDLKPYALPVTFKQSLAESVALALAINTEKARSEFIIAPLLMELKRTLSHRISLFSGIHFDVNSEQGLVGFCDFLLSYSTEQLYVSAPVITIVEAKNENIISGLGQCLAEMVAAQQFNRKEDSAIDSIYGAVTTGSVWRFLWLNRQTVKIDQAEYHIDQVEKIMAILVMILSSVSRELLR
ncbi:hypothetical protein D5085_06490 [Ectothiorhodospiraceae bacterium BW-2]|nr:hypothetical protein D5085_06490 [Ectothiorhodospiraceae bacterium BW-2]